ERTVVSGAALVAAGIRVLTGSHQAMARLRQSGAIGGLVAVGVGLYTVLTIRDHLRAAAPTHPPRGRGDRALDSGRPGLPTGIGLYLVIAGGVQGIAAALLALGSRDEPAASSGNGLRGWAGPRGGGPGPP